MRRPTCAALAAVLLLAGCGRVGRASPRPPSVHAPAASGALPSGGSPAHPASRSAATPSPPVPPLQVTGTVVLHLRPPTPGAGPVTLGDVAFASGQDGAAVGYRCGGTPEQCSGVVVTTRDGGGTWSGPITLPRPLTHVRFLAKASFGWAWGPDALYTTADGGATWIGSALPMPQGGEPVLFASFVDARDGWLARGDLNCATQGCPISIWATTDGGGAWTEVATNRGAITAQGELANPPPNGLPWVTWDGGGDLGAGRGWLLTDLAAGAVYLTSNGGANWARVVQLPSMGPHTAAAITVGGVGWAAGAESGSSPVFATDDGGTTWKPLGALAGDVLAITPALDGGSGWALLGPRDAGNAVAVLTAGGVGPAHAAPGAYRLEAVDPLSATDAWAVATGPWAGSAVLRTTDGGAHWSVRYRIGTDVPAGPWAFWNPTQGWAVGATMDPSAVLRTADAGRTWSVIAELPTTNVLAAGFPSPTFGWVLTRGGTVLVSRDGGASWAPAPGWDLPTAGRWPPGSPAPGSHGRACPPQRAARRRSG